jgi:hypothetical protein
VDQPPVVEMYYQTPGNIVVIISLKKEIGRSHTPDMNADIITQSQGENQTFGSGGTLVVFLADVLELRVTRRDSSLRALRPHEQGLKCYGDR